MSENQSPMWIVKNLETIWYFVIVLIVGIRNEFTTRRLAKTVYSDFGDVRLATKADLTKLRCEMQDLITSLQRDTKDDLAKLDRGIETLLNMHLKE